MLPRASAASFPTWQPIISTRCYQRSAEFYILRFKITQWPVKIEAHSTLSWTFSAMEIYIGSVLADCAARSWRTSTRIQSSTLFGHGRVVQYHQTDLQQRFIRYRPRCGTAPPARGLAKHFFRPRKKRRVNPRRRGIFFLRFKFILVTYACDNPFRVHARTRRGALKSGFHLARVKKSWKIRIFPTTREETRFSPTYRPWRDKVSSASRTFTL